MVEILPFQGYRYEKSMISSFKDVVSPPYDVINSEMQTKLHEGSENSIAHIIKGKKHENDSEVENEYVRAANLLDTWIEKGVLVRDERPSIYVLAQDFEVEGERMTRAGFITLLKLEDMCSSSDLGERCTGVHQHEETMPKDIQDRLNLLRATRANFGMIFSIYSDESRVIDSILEDTMKGPPLMEVADDDGITHRLWAITEEHRISRITGLMKDRYIIIADGHHRYKTALQYSREHPDDESAGYRMMALVNTMNRGLVILPTHRLVQGVEDFEAEALVDSLKGDFNIEEFTIEGENDSPAREAMFQRMEEHFDSGQHAFGLYCKDGKYYTLVLKDEKIMDSIRDHSDAWKHLDVTILHRLILENRLGIDKEKLAAGTIEGGSYVEYIKAVGDAVSISIDKVNNMGYQAVFFMNPTRVSEVEEVATNHETMPQKSTFFYPKIYTGFVINRLHKV